MTKGMDANVISPNVIKQTKLLKKRGEVLTLKLRVDVIRESSNGLSQRALALKFNCSKTQIQNILKDKDRLLQEWQNGGNPHAKRKRRQRHENVNNFVWEWFKEARAKGLPLSGPILQAKAREFAAFFNVEKFNASNGWLDSFKRRHSIMFQEILGESESGKSNLRQDISNICDGYSSRDIFRLDETGLYFRSVPNRTAALHCSDNAHDRITLLFCINALGEKEEPVVVHSGPNTSLADLDWYVNENSLMSPDIFCQWVSQFNEKMSREKRNVVLLLDNAPCHPLLELSNVKFVFLPNHLLPLDQGVIQAFKILYKRRMLRSLVARLDNSITIAQLAKQISISEAVIWIKSAWSEVKPVIALRLFAICGVRIDQVTTATLEDDIATELDNIAVEISSLGEAAGIDVDLEPESNHIVRCYDTGGDWEKPLHEAIGEEDSKGDTGEDEKKSIELLHEAKEEEYSKEDTSEDKKKPVEPVPLSQALSSLAALKALANKLGSSTRLTRALEVAEEELENIIVTQKLQ